MCIRDSTFAAQLPFGTQRFARFSEENYMVTVIDPGDAPDIVKGDIIFLEEDAVEISSSTDTSSGLTSGSISLNLPSITLALFLLMEHSLNLS